MTKDIQFLMLLAVVALLFITEMIPLAITAMGGAIACGLLGMVPVKTVFTGTMPIQRLCSLAACSLLAPRCFTLGLHKP